MFRKLVAAVVPLALLGTANAGPLDPYRGAYRPVIIFASDAGTSAYREQVAAVQANAAGFRERDMIVMAVVSGSVKTIVGGAVPRAKAEALRSAYGVSPTDFQVVLVGKDGGVKQRNRDVVPAAELFRLVDGMPMRQDEMRR